MERELILLSNVSDEELEESFESVSSQPGIIVASVLSSYDEFLETVLGYIHDECKKDAVDTTKLHQLISKASKVINNAETANVNKNKEEIKNIKEIVINTLIEANEQNSDRFDFGIKDKLEIKFSNEFYKYVKEQIINNPVSKRRIIEYILMTAGVLPKESLESYEYNDTDFIDYLVKKNMTKSVKFDYEDIASILNQIIEDEKNVVDYDMTRGKDMSEYKSKYPSLARVVLLIDTKEKIDELIKKYKNEPMFVGCLKLFKESLSNYDKSFMDFMKISIPVGNLNNLVRSTLVREMSYDLDFLYNTDEIAEKATIVGLSEKTNQIEGAFKAKEIMACLPDDFKDKMYSAYNETKDNEYAVLLSRIISKYCTTKDGKKYNPKKVQILLLNAYSQYIQNVSKQYEHTGSKPSK